MSSSMGPMVDSSSYRQGSMFVSITPRLIFSTSIAWGSSGSFFASFGDLLLHSLESRCFPQTWLVPAAIGNFIARQWIDITAFKALNNGLPSTPLKTDGQFTVRKSITTVVVWGGSPRVTASLIVPSRITLYPVNP